MDCWCCRRRDGEGTPVNDGTRIVLEGGLTRDPELAFAASGTAHVRFSVAVGSRQKNQDGTWGDGPSAFWDCVAFKGLAEHVAESLHKGDRVIVVGTLKPEKYQAKDGTEKNVLKVMVDNVGPSLLFAQATVTKVSRSGGAERPAQRSEPQQSWDSDPWAGGGYSDTPPF